ncbi:hypothetical protein ABBQ32_006524 [Trebouxia sp. C0010 RCD-2024]
MSDLTQEFVDVFCEFVEAVIHQVLHLRRIYRPELFERHRLYGITTRKSRHPDLNEYIHGITTSIKGALLQGLLHKFSINILGEDGMLVERYVLQSRVSVARVADLDPLELEHTLRGFLLKLQFADAWMKQLPQGCTFEVAAYTTDRSALPLQLWVEDEECERRLGAPEPSIMPIKSAKLGTNLLQIQLYAEC